MLKAKTELPASSGEDRASGQSQGTPGALASCGGDRWLASHTALPLYTPPPLPPVGVQSRSVSPWEKSELSKGQREASSQQEASGMLLSTRTLELRGGHHGCCTHTLARYMADAMGPPVT